MTSRRECRLRRSSVLGAECRAPECGHSAPRLLSDFPGAITPPPFELDDRLKPVEVERGRADSRRRKIDQERTGLWACGQSAPSTISLW